MRLVEGQPCPRPITLTKYSALLRFQLVNSSFWAQVELQISSPKSEDLSQDQTVALWLQPLIGFLGLNAKTAGGS